jgi:metal-responsive CopG/Arc/MetJ family transcriptional regulator
MQNVKTAISIDKSLFAQANALARSMKISRSRLFVVALEDYMRQHENRKLLEEVNAVYADEPSDEEKELLRRMRKSYRRLVEGQWTSTN